MLSTQLRQWDGKSTQQIRQIYANHWDNADFLPELIDLLKETATQEGASWCIKHYLEKSGIITAEAINHILTRLETLESWQSQLHILQCLPYWQIPDESKLTLERFLRSGLIHNNKFVRAWSYGGFYQLSQQYPEYEKEAQEFIEMAMRDEAASVKARIRQCLKAAQ